MIDDKGEIMKSLIKKFDMTLPIDKQKNFTAVTREDVVVDYRDVTVEGYAATFVSTTKADRYGDYILPNAFAGTLENYKKNSVVLQDHVNSVDYIAGRTEIAYEDIKGLRVKTIVSNAPDKISLRFKIVEGTLNAFSIGGFFYYLEDGYGIYKIDLLEYSFVAIPANPDALIQERVFTSAITKEDEKKYCKIFDVVNKKEIEKISQNMQPQNKKNILLNVGNLKILN